MNTASIAVGAVTDDRLATPPSASATPNTLVRRNASGGFAAGEVTVSAIRFPDNSVQTTAPTPGVTDHGNLTGLGDDDHAQYLLASGARATTNGFAVTGPFGGAAALPASGAGTRLLWYPAKAAFRAGSVTGTQWDDGQIGDYSIAMGLDSRATATGSVAIGETSTASGLRSTAIGYAATASGAGSTAMGDHTQATGAGATALGFYARAAGKAATAMGDGAVANGDAATAMGDHARAEGDGSTAMGEQTRADGDLSTVMGTQTTAQAYASLVIGRYNVVAGTADSWIATDPLFVAGNGPDGATRSNALTLYKNGDLEIAGTLTQSSDARLKEEIEPLEGVLERVLRLQPVTYRFKEGVGRSRDRQIGLLAQEVAEQFPELVKTEADGYLSLSYTQLTAVLLQALREQEQRHQAELAEQAAHIAVLEQRLAELEALLGQRR